MPDLLRAPPWLLMRMEQGGLLRTNGTVGQAGRLTGAMNYNGRATLGNNAWGKPTSARWLECEPDIGVQHMVRRFRKHLWHPLNCQGA